MALQLHRPVDPLLPAAPCPSTLALLLLCLLLLSCSSHQKPCTCSRTTETDPSYNLTVSGAFGKLPGYLVLTNPSCSYRASLQRVGEGGLSSYLTPSHPALNLSQSAWFFVRQLIRLQVYDYSHSYEVSFSAGFTMSTYRPENQSKARSRLVFTVQPSYLSFDSWDMFTQQNWESLLGPSSRTGSGSDGSRLSVEIAVVRDNTTLLYLGSTVLVQIGIDPPGNTSVPETPVYSVWIDYDHVSHHMSVYVDAGEGTPKPRKAIASKRIFVDMRFAFLGLFSSVGQLLQVHTWNSTVHWVPGVHHQPVFKGDTLEIILLCVIVSAATTAVTAVLVFLYVNSRYRRWKKEQDELRKIMQGIPGVPTHVDFSVVTKATNNFHETMKLGKGGFGAVYRCTLPAGASRTGRAMDVAVKKFTRGVEDCRYGDFIAEVSIINRLRHKNIVPLVGWSYNKGEPLLVYEYMTNGSLDQHIFQKRSARQPQHHQQHEDTSLLSETPEDTSLRQWNTRYSIARDIATGLHYVHHEHEPMVLHRDIKASNIMLDADFRGRLGDFGIACTVAVNRSSVTGIAGTWGYIAPDYAMSHKATRQTDIYAFGVLILEVVTGKKNGDVPPGDDHITDWIWRLHGNGTLLEAVDASMLAAGEDDGVADEAQRLLLLGLACTNPNPFDRPSMAEVLQVITKVWPPPDVPSEKPSFVWPPQDWRSRKSVYSTAETDWNGSLGSTVVSLEQLSSSASREQGSVRSRATISQEPFGAVVQSCLEETDHRPQQSEEPMHHDFL